MCCSLRRSATASTNIFHHRVSISDLFLGPRYAKERELPGPGISRCASWLSGCGEVKYMRLNMGTVQIWPFQILLMGGSIVMMINHGTCFNDFMVFPRFSDKSISCLKSFGRWYPQIFRNWTCHHLFRGEISTGNAWHGHGRPSAEYGLKWARWSKCELVGMPNASNLRTST